jgi:hypothetical protein
MAPLPVGGVTAAGRSAPRSVPKSCCGRGTPISMATGMGKPVNRCADRCANWVSGGTGTGTAADHHQLKKAYFEVEGRPGSQPGTHPRTESGQGTPEPVRPAEVRQRCDTQQVNAMALRERHPVAAKSDTPVPIPAFLNLGLHNPSRDHNREGQALSISSPRRDLQSFPCQAPDRACVNHRHPTGSPWCEEVTAATGAKAPSTGRLLVG